MQNKEEHSGGFVCIYIMRRDLDETLGSFLSRRNKQGARKDDAVNMKDTGKMVSASWYE